MTDGIRNAMKMELHRQLADATNLVWLLQNTLAEREVGGLGDLEEYAYGLREKASVILGHVVRWGQMEEER